MTKAYGVNAVIGVTGVFLFGCVVYALYRVFETGTTGFASVAVLILVGLAAFIGLMNALSISAHLIGITDAKQPFGLPEGTVRAILTIAFIILVGVLASYMLTNSAGREPFGEPFTIKAVPAKDVDAQVQRLQADGLVSVVRGTDAAVVDIQIRPRRDYRLADDVSKQILTMLSTILAAMIGFYFGAQTPTAQTRTTPASPEPAEADERSKIDNDLGGLATQVAADHQSADAKLTAAGNDDNKKKPVQAVIDSLNAIDAKIAAARKKARDTTVSIDDVRTSQKDAQTAANDLANLRQKLQAM
jgi:hypothetical protein